MPTISKGDKVLVSGANGYLAMWVVRTFLERDYVVRGTVRNDAKAKFVKAYFSALGYGDRFETVLVGDITKEGAFDDAVKGVDAIAHTASPFHVNSKTPDELFRPAVQGTIGMLTSALKHGSKIKRVVVTSSCAAVQSTASVPTRYSEKDWNTAAIQEVEDQGDGSSGAAMYMASKTLAEQAAWKFVKDHGSEVGWDLAVINPPYVFGPAIHDVSSITTLNTSLQLWIDTITSTTPKSKDELLDSNAWVDVRDVALGHVLALERPEAGGERIIVAAGAYIWQEWLDTAAALPANPLEGRHALYKGDPRLLAGERTYSVTYDVAKEGRILGIKFRTMADTTRDTLEDVARRGW
ncbi:hypothetical protein HYPSUDRAFT_204330 [Hypholoma sublateritium FD-334 SS-4]|uniref:NAD-dependent epimerase/dehydratase domain-containing protein n=1 Tax=Hypholoma sublateritium (strain FD-334 SS-4) TaxID=945553 RepID=A0A0D2NLL6_HYPSF|nr:hypothetical protein HYPSUDRAFT_204330 [Hypholoma sublateritium FD-334 SS-4]